MAVPIGKMVDGRGGTGILIAGGMLVLVTLLALLAPTSLWLLAIAISALGVGHLALVVAGQTLIAKGSHPERRDARFATLTGVNGVAQILGPALTGVLVGEVVTSPGARGSGVPNSSLVLGIAAACALLATLAAASLELRPGALVRRTRCESAERGAFAAVMRIPGVPAAMLASLTVLTAIDLLVAYLLAYGQQHGLSARTVGFLLATEAVAALAVRLLMLRLIAAFSRRKLLITTMSMAAVSLASVPFWGLLANPVPPLFAAMLLAGFGLGIGQPLTMAWVAAQTPPRIRGTAVSIRLNGNRLGQTLVPIAAGDWPVRWASLWRSGGRRSCWLCPQGSCSADEMLPIDDQEMLSDHSPYRTRDGEAKACV